MQDSDIEKSQVDLQERCKEEQSVEDQLDEPDEVDGKDMAEEDKARENVKCGNLMNIYQSNTSHESPTFIKTCASHNKRVTKNYSQ